MAGSDDSMKRLRELETQFCQQREAERNNSASQRELVQKIVTKLTIGAPVEEVHRLVDIYYNRFMKGEAEDGLSDRKRCYEDF